ncbi:MAG: T9SS type A sorting domain-containing protein [Methylotenera sp.]|nr:T9SS type A sorting domain-containing protein [Flavobacterium sp.]
MKNSKLIFFVLFVIIKTSLLAQISFTKLPNQPSDNIVSIVSDPTNNDIYAAATIKVVKSIDAGVSYTLTANTGVGNLNVLYFTPSGVLYAGVDKSNTNSVGLIKYNKATNIWSEILGSPQDITAIVEDNLGNLIVGTGTTGNYGATNPINKSTGMFYYTVATATWTTINSGLPNVPTYTVFPFIKSLVKTSAGLIIAGTYGNGVLQFSGTTWSSYGTGLSNMNVNALALNTSGQLFAGTDAGVSSIVNAANAWTNSSAGLPINKPVRTVSMNASGTIFAGLGFYHYQNGNMAGDIYSSSNNGVSWQNTSTGYVGGVVYSLLAHSSGNVVLGSAGIWKSTNNGGLWSFAMNGVSLANQTIKMVKNSLGHIFVMCRNNALGTRLPFGGVFRSTDNGTTWTQTVDGIKAQDLTVLFIDSQDNIWVAGNTQKPNANGTGTIWGTPELYKSTNNGTTWIKNTSIVVAGDSYDFIKETNSGKLYVASSFGTGQTNLSSSTDFNTFDNTLNLPPNNGYHTFGLAVNNANDVFLGTETMGLMRSTSNGAAGSFTSVTSPVANTIVNIDTFCQDIYSNVSNIMTTGVNFYCSNNNGNSFFPLLNAPTYWAHTNDMAFTNTGKIYTAVNSSHFNQVGLYLMQSPVNTNSAFTQLISFGTLSFYFESLFIDKCGYMYGVAKGNGIAVSNARVNTPRQTALSTPVNNAANVVLTPTLTWNSSCDADSYRVQVAATNTFSTTLIDQATIVGNTYVVPTGILNPSTTYYWRVIATNDAGIGTWSNTFNFNTDSALGNNQNYSQPTFTLYPNPTNGKVFLKMENLSIINSEILFFDALGKLVKSKTIQNTMEEIELNFQSGFYFFKIIDEAQNTLKAGKLLVN